MPTSLPRNEIELCAELAGIRLSATEIEAMRGELGRILAYAAELAQPSAEGATPRSTDRALASGGAPPLQPSTLRPDRVEHSLLLDREAVLAHAPARERDCFVVPAVLPAAESERERAQRE